MSNIKKNSMKQLSIFLLSLMVCVGTYAGEPRLSIWGSYSYGKGVSKVSSNTSTSFWFNGPEYGIVLHESDRGKSAASLGIDYRVTGGLYLGLTWTTGGKFSESGHNNPQDETEAAATYKTNYMLFSCKYEWLRFSKLRFYSRAGIGVGFTSGAKIWLADYWANMEAPFNAEIKDTRGPSERVAWQFSPVGIEYKPYRFLGVFAEGGFGNQGNMIAGVRLYPL